MKRTTGMTGRRGASLLTAVAALVMGAQASSADVPPPPAELPEPITTLPRPSSNSPASYRGYDEPPPPAAPSTGAHGCAPGCATNGCLNGCGEPDCGCEDGGICYELGDPWTLTKAIHGDCPPPVTIGGWFQVGYHNKSNGMFNAHPHRANLHQGWLYMERVADGSNGMDFGGRVDVVYGVDAQNTQAFGNNPGRWDYQNGYDHGIYGWAMPQLYGEVAWGDVSVKAGHFYTLLGYEVVPATGNFFYSHAFTMNFSEAFTHTGALATVKAGEGTTLYGGWTAGWDTGFDRFEGGSNFLGGVSQEVFKGLTLTYITTVGNLGWLDDGYSHSVVADWTINDKWNYVVQSDLVDANNFGERYDTIGVNQYLFYTVCDTIKVGGRAEWWKADGTSYYQTTFGVNYRPIANLVIRPELRYQWAPGTDDDNAFGIPVNTGMFGVDAILTY